MSFQPQKIIHKELSYRVNGCIFDVHDEVGPGLRRNAIRSRIGIGYAETTYRHLAIVEFRSRGLECDGEVEVSPMFRDRKLPKSPIKPLLVNGRVCVQIGAIHDKITARAVRTMQTHLRLTGCQIGIIACFGKTKFMIRGVRR